MFFNELIVKKYSTGVEDKSKNLMSFEKKTNLKSAFSSQKFLKHSSTFYVKVLLAVAE